MKQNDAAKYHAKRPHTTRPTHHAASHHSGKKVFDVMRPGKAPASPTSRPVIVGHKAEAQKTQAAVSGIGEAASAATPHSKISIQPLHSEEFSHATQVAAAASAITTTASQPEDMPAGAPPLAVAVDPESTVSKQGLAAKTDPERVAPQPADTPPSSGPSLAADQPPSLPKETPEPAAPTPPAPVSQADPGVTHNLTHGKTVLPPQPSEAAAAPQPAPAAVPAPAASPAETIPFGPVELNPPPGKPVPDAAPNNAKSAAPPALHPQDIQDIVVSHHATSVWWHTLLLLVLVIIFGAIALNILLDAEIINLNGIPHTDFF